MVWEPKREWHGIFLVGTCNVEANTAGLATATAIDMSGLPGDGQILQRRGPLQLSIYGDITVRTITAKVSVGLASLGLTATSIGLEEPTPGVYAPVVYAEALNPAALEANDPYPAQKVFGNLNQYLGTYLEIDDSEGNPAVKSGYVMPLGESGG